MSWVFRPGGQERAWRSEAQLSALMTYLLLCQAWLLGFRRNLAGAEGLNTRWVGSMGEKMCVICQRWRLGGMGLQQVFCYREGGEAAAWLERRKPWRPTLRPHAAWRFPGNACWCWRLGWVWGKDAWKRRSKWSFGCGSLSRLRVPRKCLLELEAEMKVWERPAATDDHWGVGLGGRSEHLRWAYQHPCHAWHEGFQGIPAAVGGWVKKWVRKWKLGEGYMCDPLKMVGWKVGSSRCSLPELWMRLADRIWRNGTRGKDLRLVYLLPLSECKIYIYFLWQIFTI